MTARLIDGKAIAGQITAELRTEVSRLRALGLQPGLAVVLVGDDPASASYVRAKRKACEELGIHSETIHLPAQTSQEEVLATLRRIVSDGWAHGLLVQLPLPPHIDERAILEAIPPAMDVDGFHPINRGKLVSGEETLVPCTPAGIQELLLRSGFDPDGQHVVIVGRSQIVGLPLAILLAQKAPGANATVTLCHSRTKDLAAVTRTADILVAALGRAQAIKADMVRPGAVVIDVGVNRVQDSLSPKGYRLVGDVDFEAVSQVAGAITPVPGGVGPMTIAMLMRNTVKAAKASLARH
ncbi:MAG: bifunctional methylenetetrahydrofolate dehydrogenase/methenyltetrahydrofolate cyclohydrolase FolD [candidate division KSB1 bacterium]|nr:bifunctional methylenetetrahydrofolate dehydrogenase/methenyltetrahydrofolate cyclohydrolase FolD [candidate division KSB1 bacterium]MDZ7294532.1 bifunctional methylenetetrahydrofolate dehydrogenase/methenyltetrahydrofolate cyclohydrolase FolD [candidate division KSB1 bacterium]MDZ7386186.1 bifunctional methylenetetrahydrofolate dehydrogenase/methenyltetrahydrofolate cyclohydrolase FolD [candidate division KSB1 bacterium]MDZ7392415.1 bifunctional methylenetetrahydrofolate dehydrogenase/methen